MSKFFTCALRFSKHVQQQQQTLIRGVSLSYQPTVATAPLVRRCYSTEPSSSLVNFEDIQTIIKNKNKNCHLIDVREKTELMQGYIPTAKNVPLSQFGQAWTMSPDDFEAQFGFPKPDQNDSLVVYCQAGIRSAKAAGYLSQIGFKKIQNYQGSWADYASKIKST
ncbi:Rhodanese-like domain-containing protein [Chlamydoabsidia padenii]|nr:Rhodanese-like domain-containing protein [Chlamydoabsidia padenii]